MKTFACFNRTNLHFYEKFSIQETRLKEWILKPFNKTKCLHFRNIVEIVYISPR